MLRWWIAPAAVLLVGGLGVAVLAALGAPLRLLAMNLGATLASAILLPLFATAGRRAWRHPTVTLLGVVAAIWVTALWGADLEGVRRWARLGPFLFHVGFLGLPIALAMLPRTAWPAGLLGAGLIGAGLVAQPDGGTALAFATGAAVHVALRRSAGSLVWIAVAVIAAAAAWLRPDPLPAVQFVEQVGRLAVGRSPALGVLAFLALALPSAALAIAAWRERDVSGVAAPAAGFWFGAAAASLLGNYPTPIVGAGVTPVLAYALTWAIIVTARDAAARTRTSPRGSPGSAASPP